jgi:hypothetical protein
LRSYSFIFNSLAQDQAGVCAVLGFVKRQWNDIKGNFKFWIFTGGATSVITGLVALWHRLAWWEILAAGCCFASGWMIALAAILERSRINIGDKGGNALIYNPINGRLRLKPEDYDFHSPYYYEKTNPGQPLCPRCFISDAKCPMGEAYVESGMECRRCLVCEEIITPFGVYTGGEPFALEKEPSLQRKARALGTDLFAFLREKGPEPNPKADPSLSLEDQLREVQKASWPYIEQVFHGYEGRFRQRVIDFVHELGENGISVPGLQESDIRPPHGQNAERIKKIAGALFAVAAWIDAAEAAKGT